MTSQSSTRSRRARSVGAIGLLVVLAAAAVGFATTRSSHSRPARAAAPSTAPPSTVVVTTPRAPRGPTRYRELEIARLTQAVADPVAGAIGAQVLFAGGLDGSGTSTARVGSISGTTVRPLPDLPSAYHDAAGALLGGALYTFGGGNGVAQLDSIVRVTAAGTTTTVDRLPARSSDSSAAVVGTTAYVVGGYDGSHWLDTIVAFALDGRTRVVAHLPVGIRYAAVGSVDGRVIIAGGMSPTAHATSAIYSYDPGRGAVTKIGDLPAPISHAAATGVGDELLIAGGQSIARQPSNAIVAVDATTGAVRAAGTLATARSDAALVNANGRLLLIGGKGAGATLDLVSELVTAPPAGAAGVYANDGPNELSAVARSARPLVYVPNSQSDTVTVIDPATYKVVDTFRVGALPQHVTPAWNMKTLYVDNDRGNSLTPIDPRTGKRAGRDIAVTDPYNLYFTTDGRYAIVVAEARQELDFRDARTMRLVTRVPVPCRGVDHMDYTANGRLALASCEFSGQMVVIDLTKPAVRATLTLPAHGVAARPQDVKLSPDGRTFYVADMNTNGVWEIDARTFAVERFLPTGAGADGLYPSRDATRLYVTNRAAGTISVIDFASRKIVQTWRIPGGSPDMGGVSADGKVLWLSGRYSASVYALSTRDGHVIATIRVGNGPHGLCVWPQPGRYSIGHTGITR